MGLREICATTFLASALYAACGEPLPSADPSVAPSVADAGEAADAARDASADTGADADPTPRRFCETFGADAALCADFDEGMPADFGFTAGVGAPASRTVDLDGGLSPPAALRVVADGATQAYLSRNFTLLGTNRWEASMALRLGDHAGGGFSDLVVPLQIELDGSACVFDLVLTPNSATFNARPNGPTGVALTRRPLLGRWSRLEVRLTRVDLDAGVAAEVFVDDLPALTKTATTCAALLPNTLFSIGAITSLAPIELRIDDVLFSAE